MFEITGDMSSSRSRPSLKSASGAGFSFEDKVAATLMAEMLAGQRSLGDDYEIATLIERQANDWEPFGDVLITAPNQYGVPGGGEIPASVFTHTTC